MKRVIVIQVHMVLSASTKWCGSCEFRDDDDTCLLFRGEDGVRIHLEPTRGRQYHRCPACIAATVPRADR